MATQPSIDFDPKNQRLFTLVKLSEDIAYELTHSPYQASKILASLFGLVEIDPDSKELRNLQNQYVQHYETTIPRLTPQEIRTHSFKLQEYLNQTYFKGWSIAKPKFKGEGHI